MPETTHSVSEDGRSCTAEATLSAPGVYDPELQLNGDQVIAMKGLFQDRGSGGENLQHMVVAEIVTGMLVEDSLADDEDSLFYDEEEAELLRNPKVVEMIQQAAYLGSHWHQGLIEGIALPGSEWPEYTTPPATFAEPLKRPEVAAFLRNLISSNPAYDFSKHIKRIETVIGKELDLSPKDSDG